VSAFDELERQLSDSVATRARAGTVAVVAGLGRWWRVRVGRGALIVAMPALFLALVGTATLLRSGTPLIAVETPSASVAGAPVLVASARAGCRPCRTVSDQLHAPLADEGHVGGVVPAAPRHVTNVVEGRVHRGLPVVKWAQQALREDRTSVG
jgi:hypothetical protein